MPSPLLQHWSLDPDAIYLNHGAFGACPRAALEVQAELRQQLERQPVQFLDRDLPELMREANRRLAAFLGADPDDLVPVANATTGVNTVLRSLPLEPGDELLTTDHAYNACRNALDRVAAASGAQVVVAPLPFPCRDAAELQAAILERVTPRTVLALLDHVTSPTALVLPIESLVRELTGLGVETLIDGAHAPGMVPLDLGALGASFYTGNAHKWLCAPKGAAFLHVGRALQAQVRPLVVSHGANRPLEDESQRFRAEFEWTGTTDPTPYLCIPAALDVLDGLIPGGWPALRERNHALVVAARRRLLTRWGIEPPCPEAMLGSIASIPLRDAEPDDRRSMLEPDPWQLELWQRHRIEVPLFAWPAPPRRMLRISAQCYNTLEDYDALADALDGLVG